MLQRDFFSATDNCSQNARKNLHQKFVKEHQNCNKTKKTTNFQDAEVRKVLFHLFFGYWPTMEWNIFRSRWFQFLCTEEKKILRKQRGLGGKGTNRQLNSEWIYEVIVSPKMQTENCKNFCPAIQTRIVEFFWWFFGESRQFLLATILVCLIRQKSL